MKNIHLFVHNNAKWFKLLMLVPFVLWGVYFFSNRYLAYPLEFTPQQNVLREPPVFHLDESVDVEAIFKNDSQKDIGFITTVHWVLVSPLKTGVPETDTRVTVPGLEEVISPGCTKIEFANSPPNGVISITNAIFVAGYDKVTWRLTGHNVITDPEGRGSMVFNVDQFTYIPDETPLPPYQIIHNQEITCDGV